MVMGAVWALCEFSLLVTQQNHSELSLAALHNAVKGFYPKKGAFRNQKMSNSAMAKLDELLGRESHQLWEHTIHKICAAMEVQMYGAEKITTSKHRQFQVGQNRAQQVATIWSDADRQRAFEQLERQFHQVIPAKCKLFDKLFQHHERHLLQDVGTKATGPRSILAKKLAQMKTAEEEEDDGVVNITADNRVQFQVSLCDDEIEATTCSITDTDCIDNQLEREIYSIALKGQMRFTKAFSIPLVECKDWWQAMGVQELRNTINQCVIHFGYPQMDLVNHISESIGRNGFRRQFQHRYFWMGTYRHCERGISIYQQSQSHSTDAKVQWLVYRYLLYGGDTVISCPTRLVWYC